MLEWLEDGTPETGKLLELANGNSARLICHTNACRYGSGEVGVALYYEPFEKIAVITCSFT